MEFMRQVEYTYQGKELIRSRMIGIKTLESSIKSIDTIKGLSPEITDLNELKELSKFFNNLYWKKYVISKHKSYFKNLSGKQFRATFGHIKSTITIEFVELPSYFDFENKTCKEHIADDIQFAYTTSDSLKIYHLSLKDLIEKNQVDFDNPIEKGWK